MSRPTLLLVLAVLAGTAVAFAETERLKVSVPPIVGAKVQPQFSPVCGCAESTAAILLQFHRADTISVTVLNSTGHTVRVLASSRNARGRIILHWDGRDDSGALVPDGTYSVHVRLSRAGRTIDLPKHIVVDTVAPTAELVGYQPHVLSLGAKPSLVVRYRLSEPAHAVLYVNGRLVLLTYSRATSAKLKWFARIDGRRLRRGRYRLQLAALDLAGNLGARTPVFVVRIR